MTTQTTNKLLILNAILLGSILTFLLILNFDALKNKLGHQKEEAIEPDYEDHNQVKLPGSGFIGHLFRGLA
jgi:hypothetical protein